MKAYHLNFQSYPGRGSAKHAGIQNVINNLYISELIYRDEEDSLVKDYVNTRKIQLVTVCMSFGM